MNSSLHCLKCLQKVQINQTVVSNVGRAKNDINDLKIPFLLPESVEAAIFPAETAMWNSLWVFLSKRTQFEKPLPNSGSYLEPSRTFKMELFAEKIIGF